MISMLTRHAIQVLRAAGHTQSEVAELTGVSEREIRRIEEEEPVSELAGCASRGTAEARAQSTAWCGNSGRLRRR